MSTDARMTKTEYRRALETMETTAHKFAEEIGVSVRQSYRYSSGETTIPPAMAILVRMLVKKHRLNAKV